MRIRAAAVYALVVFVFAMLAGNPAEVWAGQNQSPQQLAPAGDRNERQVAVLKEEVRHQLVTLPYYSVFDWLQAEVAADGTVTLMAASTQPTVKRDARSRVMELEGATHVVDNIEVLPLSNNDDQLRLALYRAIHRENSPLFRYAMQSVGPIHIIVKNGHVTLKGMVSSQADSQLAYIAARGVPGAFEIRNELQVEIKS